MIRSALAAFAAALALATPAAAQQAAPVPTTPLDSLSRVRVTQTWLEPRRLVGELASADTADLTVQRNGERLTIPLAYVQHLEVSAARRSSSNGALRGAIYGFLGGATATGLFVLASKASGSDCTDCIWNPSTGVFVLGLPLTGVTTLTGAAVGATRPGDYWVRVAIPVRLN